MIGHRKYALLENGSIQSLWYDEEEPRMIENIEGEDFLVYDKITLDENTGIKSISLCLGKIIQEADTIEELEALKNDR